MVGGTLAALSQVAGFPRLSRVMCTVPGSESPYPAQASREENKSPVFQENKGKRTEGGRCHEEGPWRWCSPTVDVG